MVDADWVDFGSASESGPGQRSPGLSEHQDISSAGSAEKGSAAVDAVQHQTSATAAPPTNKEGADDYDSAVVVEAPPRSFEAEDSAAAAEAPLPSAEDYSCPICLELLLRPIKLSCGHCLCRGCWTRVLQGSTVHIYHRGLYCSQTGLVAAECTCTGPPHEKATCPLGRCRVMQIVPAVDVALMNELYSRFGPQLTARATEHALADEDILANAVTAQIGEVTSWASSDLGTADVAAPWAETEYWTPREERGGDGWALRVAQWDPGVIRGPSRLERTRATNALSVPLCIFVTGVLAVSVLFIWSVCLIRSTRS